MAQGKAWANRIVGYGEEAPADLLTNPANFRLHPKPQQDALAGAFAEVGILQNVIKNVQSGYLIDGHLRVALAHRDGQPTLPVTYVDLTPAEEAFALATLDPISAMAATDRDRLAALLEDVSTGEAAVQAMIADMAEREGIVDGFLDDARESGDGSSPWPDDEGEDQNRLVLPVTPGQRDAIMAAVKRVKAADVSLRTTTEALVAICEAA